MEGWKIAIIVVVIVIIVALLLGNTGAVTVSRALSTPNSPLPPAQLTQLRAFANQATTLWNQHVGLTREYITSYLGDAPTAQTQAVTNTLLQNQQDLGNNLALMAGPTAGKKYADLLTDHIKGAVTILRDVKSGTDPATDIKAWRDNGDTIAQFLANLTGGDIAKFKSGISMHLDLLLQEATKFAAKDYQGSLDAYNKSIDEINNMNNFITHNVLNRFLFHRQ